MASGATFRLDQAALRRITHGSSGQVAQHLVRIARRAEGIAKRLSPVDTGRMRATIHVEGPHGTAAGVAYYLVANTNYAIYVHGGTRYLRARPFLLDAVRQAV